MNYGKNLIAHQVFPGEPWSFTGIPPIDVREDKKIRDRWINSRETDWNVYSLFEGVNPNCRIHSGKDDDDGNPPRKQDGIVCDFDAPATKADIEAGMQRIGAHKPGYWGRSLSGNAQIIWRFEKSLNLPENIGFVRRWLKFLLTKIPFHLFLIGFDGNAFIEPTRRFTNGAQWQKLSDYVIPYEIVHGWFVEFCSKDKFDEAQFQETIPLPEVEKILREKYPRLASWGEFVEGAQGESFWVEGSTSPKSAIIKAGGMLTFSAHAAKTFWPWSDKEMCGPEFVAQYKARELSRAVEDIYWDEQNFWHRDANSHWTTLNKEDMSRHLLEAGVSDRRDPVTHLSPIGKALNFVQHNQRIVGAAPFVYRTEQIIRVNQEPFLNIAKVRVMPPAPGDFTFDEKTLPFLYPFLTRFFTTHIQFEVFMAWWARTYQHAFKGRPRLGQTIFICGLAGVGKTLISRGIVALTLGGFEDPARFLSGGDNFGSHLFKVAFWALDDNTTITDSAKRRFYTEMLKAIAANRDFAFHQKYKVPARCHWLGRVIGTLNDDENSVRALPDIGRDNMDKVMFFRAASTPGVVFPSEPEIEKILAVELPIMCSILLKWEIPAHVRSNETRYEITSYHEPSLLRTAQQSSPLAAFEDIIDVWKTEYFKNNPKETEFVGTVHLLQKEILHDPTTEMALRSYPLDSINRNLAGLKSRGYAIEIFDQDGKRLYRIKRPANLMVPAAPSPACPPQTLNSQYQVE